MIFAHAIAKSPSQQPSQAWHVATAARVSHATLSLCCPHPCIARRILCSISPHAPVHHPKYASCRLRWPQTGDLDECGVCDGSGDSCALVLALHSDTLSPNPPQNLTSHVRGPLFTPHAHPPHSGVFPLSWPACMKGLELWALLSVKAPP